eukprot:SAG31_NODE_762_length_12275_cov_14.077119_7_plen_80_part_00
MQSARAARRRRRRRAAMRDTSTQRCAVVVGLSTIGGHTKLSVLRTKLYPNGACGSDPLHCFYNNKSVVQILGDHDDTRS